MSKEIKKLETEIVRLKDIVEEQNRTISSDKTLIKSLRTTLEALRSDAKASQDLHARTLHKAEYLEQCLEHRASDAEDLQICLESRDAELAEAEEQIKSLRQDRPDSEMTDSYNEQTDKEITDIILDPGRRLEKQEEYIKLIMQSLLDLSTIVLGPGWRDEPTGSFRYASNPKPGENFSPLIIERRHPSYDSAHGRKTDLQTLAEAMDELLGGTEDE